MGNCCWNLTPSVKRHRTRLSPWPCHFPLRPLVSSITALSSLASWLVKEYAPQELSREVLSLQCLAQNPQGRLWNKGAGFPSRSFLSNPYPFILPSFPPSFLLHYCWIGMSSFCLKQSHSAGRASLLEASLLPQPRKCQDHRCEPSCHPKAPTSNCTATQLSERVLPGCQPSLAGLSRLCSVVKQWDLTHCSSSAKA